MFVLAAAVFTLRALGHTARAVHTVWRLARMAITLSASPCRSRRPSKRLPISV